MSCNSHSPPLSHTGQSSGWLVSRNSSMDLRDWTTCGVSVRTTMPSATGRVHAVMSFGIFSTSPGTCGRRCLPWRRQRRSLSKRRNPSMAPALPLLRRPHAHHRDVRALDAAARAAPRSHSNRDAVVTRHGKRSLRAAMPIIPATAIRAPFARTLTEGMNIAGGKQRFHRTPGAKSRSPHPPRRDARPDAAITELGQKPKSP